MASEKQGSALKEALFTINEENLETGMRGYPVGFCPTSSVDPQKGLFYVGRPVHEIAHLEPEEVIFLLLYGHEGSKAEKQEFTKQIRERAFCSKELLNAINQLPKQGPPMKHLAIALLLCGMLEGAGDFQEDCLRIIAKIPILTAAVINHREGWGKTPMSRPDLGYIENFLQMLCLPQKASSELLEAMKRFNILHYDHGGGNLSCFIGKGVASGLEDTYGSLASAMCALSGARHGGANQDSLLFLQRMVQELGKNPQGEQVEKWVQQKIDKQEVIYGFGHAVLRVEDTRATLFYDMAEKTHSDNPLISMALLLRKHGSKVLQQQGKIADPYPNVDAISGSLLYSCGFPYPEYFTVLFGMARCVGIAIQILYERCQAREGKGTPIIRPKYYYKERSSDI